MTLQVCYFSGVIHYTSYCLLHSSIVRASIAAVRTQTERTATAVLALWENFGVIVLQILQMSAQSFTQDHWQWAAAKFIWHPRHS